MREIMRSLIIFSLVCYWLYQVTHNHNTISVASQSTEEDTVFVNGTVAIGRIDDDFVCATIDWWPPEKCDYGTCSWGSASLLNLDLGNDILLNAIKAFSPLKIRLGGTLQDRVIYQREDSPSHFTSFVKDSSMLFGFSQGYLPMSRWDKLNIFFKNAGASVIFGLNALRGRTIDSQGAAVGDWNSSNAESLIRYTVNKGYTIHGWELGNELSGSGVGTRVTADQYASDIKSLQNKVQDIYSGSKLAKPLVLAPGGFFDSNWFSQFVDKAPQSVQVLTHHIYNLGPGSAADLVDKILDPSVLDGISETFRSLQMLIKQSKTSAVAWVGEAGGAYNSGHNLVTNAFVFSFWYLDQLGMAASYDTKAYCRQTLIGGNYGLLDIKTFEPNPDYYSALLWHRLMGNNVLSTSFSGTKKLRTYAHCSKKTQGITVLLINLDGNTTVHVNVSTENGGSSGTLNSEQGLKDSEASKNGVREEYHLSAKDGDLHSQVMLLNGKELTVNSMGKIPSLEPMIVGLSNPTTVAPFSIVFVHIPNITIPACR